MYVLGEQQTEGSSQDPKSVAKGMLQEGADIEAIMAETNLSKPTILGLKGSLIKAQKRLGDKARTGLEKQQGDEGIPTESDFLRQILQDVKFSKIDAVVSLVDSYGYNVQGLYAALKDIAASLSIVRYVVKRWAAYRSEAIPGWILREIEGTSLVRPHVASNDGDSQTLTKEELSRLFDEKLKQQQDSNWRSWVNEKLQNNDGGQVSKLEAEIEEMRKEFRDQQIHDLKSEIESLRRNASAPDSVTQVVKSVENLLSEGLQHPGPIRLYLSPSEQFIKDKKEAPLLTQPVEPASRSVASELSKYGLVTNVLRKGS